MKTQALPSTSLHHKRSVLERAADFRRSLFRHFTDVSWPPGPLLAMNLFLRSNFMSLLRSYVKERRAALKPRPAEEVIDGAGGL